MENIIKNQCNNDIISLHYELKPNYSPGCNQDGTIWWCTLEGMTLETDLAREIVRFIKTTEIYELYFCV